MPIERFDTENFVREEEDLLEYVTAVADKFAPDILIDNDGMAHEIASQAPFIFKRRYNGGKLNVFFCYTDYVNSKGNEDPIDIIRALGIAPDKFWYLLLFISDYVCGSTLDTLRCNPCPIEEIESLIDFVENNEESFSNILGIRHKKPMKLTLQIKGHRLIIENPNTISAIAAICKDALPSVEHSDILNRCPAQKEEKSDSIRIWLFATMLRYFFTLYPQYAGKRGNAKGTTKSTLRLISKLAYFTKLTTNDDYYYDDENLKGILKQYHNYKIDTINAIYG